MRKIILGILTIAALVGCSSLDCPVGNIVQCYYSLQKSDGTPDTLGIDTLWVWSTRVDGKDTLLINSLCGIKATKFYLPMSHTLPMDLICLQLKDTLDTEWNDTIRLYKENSSHFESVDCQASYFHKLTKISSTHSIIDSAIINKQDVTYDASTPHILLRLKARR